MLYPNKTLFTKIGRGLDLAMGFSLLTPGLDNHRLEAFYTRNQGFSNFFFFFVEGQIVNFRFCWLYMDSLECFDLFKPFPM